MASQPARLDLSREAIRSGAIARMLREADPTMQLWSDEQRQASLDAALAGRDPAQGVWLFGYGSLIWNPAFHFDRQLLGKLYGYHRRYCMWTHLGRGTPERPGLTLGLVRGGSCHGVLFRIPPDQVACELDIVWRREMLSGAYIPRWFPIRTAEGVTDALAFVMNPAHERFAGDLTDDQVAAVLAHASGQLGSCADYLNNTVRCLHEHGIRDTSLSRLARRVEEHCRRPAALAG
jgi:cation transport protein ChaC